MPYCRVSLDIYVQIIKSICYLGNFVFPLMEESLSMYIYACDLSPRAVEMVKGQLISKCPFGVDQKTNESFVRISALASRKRSNKKKYWKEDSQNKIIQLVV